MPNLNLTHSGNMNITSASIGSGGTLNVQYEPNNTGAVTGFSFTPVEGSEFVCGDTYTITAIPKYSGTVLTETFTVKGTDIAGVPRSDSSVLRQGYDADLTHYNLDITSVGATIISSSVTNSHLEINIRIDDDEYAEIDIQPDGGSIITYPIDNISGGEEPETGSVVSAITIVVADTILDEGLASAIYSPRDAYADLTYSSLDTDKATIDPVTGEITVLSSGSATFCVTDSVSTLSDCKTVTVETSEPAPTGDTGITAITISVADEIIETGVAVPLYSPSDAEVNIIFTSSNPSIATIDSAGTITVLDNGSVQFCVEDTLSGLRDCKTVSVRKATYIDWISIVVPDTIMISGIATAEYSPTAGTVSLVYTSSDPETASINSTTGKISVHRTGEVTFCVRDLYTNKTDCKTVSVRSSEGLVHLVYNVTSTTEPTLIFSTNSCCGDRWDYFAKAVYYNGEEITYTETGKYYTFPETGEQDVYADFKTYVGDKGYRFLYSCIFRSNPNLVEVHFPADYPADGSGDGIFNECVNLREADMSCFKVLNSGCFFGCSSLTSVTMPNVEVLVEQVFCLTPIEHIYGPKVREIGYRSFSQTQKLKTADLPSAELYYDRVFCASTISDFTLASGVTSVDGTFNDANSLEILRSNAVVPPTASYYSFEPSVIKYVVVPCESVNAYKTAQYWNAMSAKTICENDIAQSISLSVSGDVVDSGQLIVNTVPAAAKTLMEYSTSDCRKAFVKDNGEIVAFGTGSVTLSCYDRMSGKSASITLDVESTYQKYIEATYNVTSTTQPTTLFYDTDDISGITVMYFEDGTILGDYVFYDESQQLRNYTFDSLGQHKVYYYAERYDPYRPEYQSVSIRFKGTTSLTFVSLPERMEEIGGGLFSGCTSLSGNIVMPETVKSIGANAFYGTMVNLWFTGSVPPSVDEYYRYDIGGVLFYVPDAYLTDYLKTVGHNGYDFRIATQTSAGHSFAYFTTPNSDANIVLKFRDRYTFDAQGNYASGVTTANIPVVNRTYSNGVITLELGRPATRIGNGSGSPQAGGVTNITLPYTIETVEDMCFWNFTTLESIVLPPNLVSIGEEAFCGCTSLHTISIPNSVTTLGEGAFFGCTNLKTANIPSGVTIIEWGVFNRTGITAITIPENVVQLKNYVFYNCTDLKKIYAHPSTAPTISNTTFNGIGTNGTLYYPSSSDYQEWLKNTSGYLGSYGWTGSPSL